MNSFSSHYKAIHIIAKLSFSTMPFEIAIKDAFEQFKENNDYAVKLKTQITMEFLPSDHNKKIAYLHKMINDIGQIWSTWFF